MHARNVAETYSALDGSLPHRAQRIFWLSHGLARRPQHRRGCSGTADANRPLVGGGVGGRKSSSRARRPTPMGTGDGSPRNARWPSPYPMLKSFPPLSPTKQKEDRRLALDCLLEVSAHPFTNGVGKPYSLADGRSAVRLLGGHTVPAVRDQLAGPPQGLAAPFPGQGGDRCRPAITSRCEPRPCSRQASFLPFRLLRNGLLGVEGGQGSLQCRIR